MDMAQIVMYGLLFVSLYFEVFLLITFFERNDTRESKVSKNQDATKLPTVAVIVPCLNEEATVRGTLNSLLKLEYPADKLEIIAVNDGSTDNTRAVLQEFEHHTQIRIIDKENGGKHTAMNAALAYTQAEIVGSLDADSFVDSDALLYVVAQFEDTSVAAVTPSIKIRHARGALQTIQKAEYALAVFIRNVFAQMDSLFVTPGPFSFFRREVLNEVGSWRYAHSTEDLELCLRLQKHHKRVTNEPNAIVYTTPPHTFPKLYKQRIRWIYGFLKNAVDYYYLFFNPRYGTLGILILPFTLVSLFSAIFLFTVLIWNTVLLILQEIVRFQTVGIAASAPQFDVFYVNTSVIITTTIALVILTFVLILLGKRLGKDAIVSVDMFVYLAFYGFIAPIWLTGALYKALTTKSISWR